MYNNVITKRMCLFACERNQVEIEIISMLYHKIKIQRILDVKGKDLYKSELPVALLK